MSTTEFTKLKIDKSKVISSSRKSKKVFYWLLFILIITPLVYFYGQKWLKPIHKVEVMTVSVMYPSQALTLLNASGYVVAQRKAAVASKVTGRLVSLKVEEGSKVKEGQIIAQLENEDTKAGLDRAVATLSVARARVEQARAELYEASIGLNRDKKLLARGFVSQSEYDIAEVKYRRLSAAVTASEAEVKASMATLKEAEVLLDYTFIRVPFDAVVLTKNADIGDIITPLGAAANAKAAVVTIADLDSLQVEVDVSESNLEKVRIDQPCEIQLDAIPDSRFRGSVHTIVPTADRTKATIMVKVRFLDKDPRILPEMSAKVAFLSREIKSEEETPRTVITPTALISGNNHKMVFVLKDDTVTATQVKLGEQLGDMVEVLDGLKAGDKIVVKPSAKLKTLDRIKVVEK